MMKRAGFLISLIASASLILAGSALAASLLSNGGFETGDLTDWSCTGTCSIDDTANYAGAYHVLREADSTLSQSITVESCDDYRVIWAARQYSAGDHAISAGFSGCDPVLDTFTPALPGETWSLHYLDIPACEGDTSFSVEFSGDSGTELDSVTLDCLGVGSSGTAPDIEAYTQELDDGHTLAVYPTFTYGDLALFIVNGLIVVGLILLVGLLVIVFPKITTRPN